MESKFCYQLGEIKLIKALRTQCTRSASTELYIQLLSLQLNLVDYCTTI
jgi:hypothetical protein